MRRIPLFAIGLSALMLTAAPAAFAQAVSPVTVGQTLTGALTDDDAEGADYRYDDFRLELRDGQRVEAILRSGDFDAYLEIYAEGGHDEPLASDDDGLDDGTDARLRFTAPQAGAYVLRVRQFSGLDGGAYTLAVTERAPAPAAGRPQAVRIGAETSGRLDATAPEDEDGAAYRDFSVRLNRDQRVAIRLNSDDFDPMVRVGRLERGVFNELAANDDGDDGLNSYLVFTAPTRGDYVIRAISFDGDGEGGFVLSLADGPAPAQARDLVVGRSQEGRLSDGSGVNGDDQRADLYRFTGREGQRIRLDLTSSDFDAYLELFRETASGRESLATNDDGGEGTDSRLIHVLPADSAYLVEARAFGGGGEGAYRLSLSDLPPPPTPASLAFGQTVRGEVNEDGAADDMGRGYVAYRFTATKGQRIQAIMRSGDFDAYLELGEAGEGFSALAMDDDGLGEGTDARLNFIAPEDGQYEIRAMPLGGSGKGLFSLELIDRGPQPEPGSILVGATVRGSLSEDDALNEEGAYMDVYRFQAKGGEKLRLTMVSNDFDAFVEVGRGDDSYSRLAFDDDGLSDTHARLDWSAPEDGPYVIRARSYGPNQMGTYALTVERQP